MADAHILLAVVSSPVCITRTRTVNPPRVSNTVVAIPSGWTVARAALRRAGSKVHTTVIRPIVAITNTPAIGVPGSVWDALVALVDATAVAASTDILADAGVYVAVLPCPWVLAFTEAFIIPLGVIPTGIT